VGLASGEWLKQLIDPPVEQNLQHPPGGRGRATALSGCQSSQMAGANAEPALTKLMRDPLKFLRDLFVGPVLVPELCLEYGPRRTGTPTCHRNLP
jgi:hypothetical protein